MKKLIILIGLFICVTGSGKVINDSVNMAGITGSDTVIVISKSVINFGKTWGIEIEYSDLSHDDATIDIGVRLDVPGGTYASVGDSTFNSYGVGLPYTLDATTNADSYYGKASLLIERATRFIGRELLIKIDPGSVTSGYIRYTIWGL